MIKKYLVTALALLALLTGVLYWRANSDQRSNKSQQIKTEPTPSSARLSGETPPAKAPPSVKEYPQLSLKSQTREEAVKEWLKRHHEDRLFEWRTPIRFYGKVVDQNNQPVAAANVHYQWTDLSEKGTSQADTTSDAHGLFSLQNQRGKNLGVYVTKEGYYDASRKENQTSFEFSSPAESSFYEPDEAHPVLFHLRKKGEAESLLQRSVEFKLLGDGSGQDVDLLTGKITGAGPLQIKTWKPPYSPEPRPAPYDWRIMIEIPGGGFVEHEDLFPFTAPETGYVANIDLHMSPELGQQWRSFIDKNYYFSFGQPRRYGRMHVRTDGDRQIIFVDYYLNPSGSRNLEFDPTKMVTTVKP